MPVPLHPSIHGRVPRVRVEPALWTAGAMILTIIVLLILFFGVLAVRAS